MEFAVTTLVLLISLSLLYVFLRRRHGSRKATKSIPGPGLLESVQLFLKSTSHQNFHLLIQKWVPLYGPVMRVNLGITNNVFFNDTKLFTRFVTESPYRDVTNDRLPTFGSKYIIGSRRGIGSANFSEELKGHRNMFHSLMKVYGEGVGELETLLTGTFTEWRKKMDVRGNVEIAYMMKRYILDLIRILLTGDALNGVEGNLDVLEDFNDSITKGIRFEVALLMRLFPFLRHIPGSRFQKVSDGIIKSSDKMFKMYLTSIRKSYVPGKKRGIVDGLLSLQENYQKNGGDLTVDEDLVKSMILTVIVAGYLTTANTLSTLLLNLIVHQDVQNRLYKDICEVMGDKSPSMEHRKHLPYVEAVIQEILRLNTVAAFLVPHVVKEDVVFEGFFFPKGTTCMMNAWHTHHNEDKWEDPWTFRPERFLNDKGELLDSRHPIREELIPFGKGRRACVGESFAKLRLFMILTNLVKSFSFQPPDPPAKLPSTDPRTYIGGLVGAPNFMCKVVKRDFNKD